MNENEIWKIKNNAVKTRRIVKRIKLKVMKENSSEKYEENLEVDIKTRMIKRSI